MQRISSKTTFYYKRVFPVMMFGFLLLFLAVPIAAGKNGPPLPFVLAPAVMAVFMYFVMKKLIFDLVDEVWDAGDALIIRNRNQEDRIPLSKIMNVSYTPLMSPPRVTLALRTPSLFGDRVTFCAPIKFNPFSSSPLLDELIVRVDAARRAAR
jgi:hypothetical protein